MLEAPHVLVGIAIAAKIPFPALSIPLALGSHFVLDMLPHWNPHLNTEMKTLGKISNQTKTIIVVDFLISGASIIIFSQMADNPAQMTNIVLCGLAGMVPDLIEAPYFFLHIKTKLLEKWIRLQKAIQTDAGPVFGIITQIVVVFAALWSILK